jgi:hypothetical protein
MKKKSSAVVKPAGKVSSAVLALQAARQQVKAAKQQVKLIKARLKQARAVAKAAKSVRAQAELAVQKQQARPTVKRAVKGASLRPVPPRKKAAGKLAVASEVPVSDHAPDGAPASAALDAT